MFSVRSSTSADHPPALAALGSTPVPNIVFFLTDDQRHDLVEYMPIVQRELVARGVSFSNAYATTPYCCPSRASMLTGLYAHHHGVLTNGGSHGGWSAFREDSTLATWLQAAGVRAMLVGKYLNGYDTEAVPPGWGEWFAFVDPPRYYGFEINENGTRRKYDKDVQSYSSDVLARKSIALLEQAPTAPFLLFVSFNGPHDPPQPAEQDKGRFDDLAPQRLPSYDEVDVSDKPSWVQKLPPLDARKQRKMDKLRREQIETLQGIDRAIGSVVDQLRSAGRLEDTWLVFMSDNGYSLGEHRYGPFKSCGYEECVRVPLVIVPPVGHPAAAATPRIADQLVMNIDIAPTFAELLGAHSDRPVDGRSLLPILNDPQAAWRTEAGLELWIEKPEMAFQGLRVERWKYLRYLNGEQELYDLRTDPFEMDNLSARPEHAARVQEFSARLDAVMARPASLPEDVQGCPVDC